MKFATLPDIFWWGASNGLTPFSSSNYYYPLDLLLDTIDL